MAICESLIPPLNRLMRVLRSEGRRLACLRVEVSVLTGKSRRYAGEWSNGQRHGQGKLTKVNGDGFKGYWTNGHPDMQLLSNPHRDKKKK